MSEVKVSIGGRDFDVACRDGEEDYLKSAAAMLDQEAQVLIQNIGRIPENKMLLMAGLMLADRTASVEDKLKASEATPTDTSELDALRAQISGLNSALAGAEARASDAEAKAKELAEVEIPEPTPAPDQSNPELETLMAENEQLKAQVSSLNAQVDTLSTETVVVGSQENQELEDLRAETQALQLKLASVQAQVNDQPVQVAPMEDPEVVARISESDNKINALSGELEAVKVELLNSNSRMEKLSEQRGHALKALRHMVAKTEEAAAEAAEDQA